jgi:hypothetical protein
MRLEGSRGSGREAMQRNEEAARMMLQVLRMHVAAGITACASCVKFRVCPSLLV